MNVPLAVVIFLAFAYTAIGFMVGWRSALNARQRRLRREWANLRDICPVMMGGSDGPGGLIILHEGRICLPPLFDACRAMAAQTAARVAPFDSDERQLITHTMLVNAVGSVHGNRPPGAKWNDDDAMCLFDATLRACVERLELPITPTTSGGSGGGDA